MVYVYQINTMYSFNLHHIICQLHFSKSGRNKQIQGLFKEKDRIGGQGDMAAKRVYLLPGNQTAFCGSWGIIICIHASTRICHSNPSTLCCHPKLLHSTPFAHDPYASPKLWGLQESPNLLNPRNFPELTGNP